MRGEYVRIRLLSLPLIFVLLHQCLQIRPSLRRFLLALISVEQCIELCTTRQIFLDTQLQPDEIRRRFALRLVGLSQVRVRLKVVGISKDSLFSNRACLGEAFQANEHGRFFVFCPAQLRIALQQRIVDLQRLCIIARLLQRLRHRRQQTRLLRIVRQQIDVDIDSVLDSVCTPVQIGNPQAQIERVFRVRNPFTKRGDRRIRLTLCLVEAGEIDIGAGILRHVVGQRSQLFYREIGLLCTLIDGGDLVIDMCIGRFFVAFGEPHFFRFDIGEVGEHFLDFALPFGDLCQSAPRRQSPGLPGRGGKHPFCLRHILCGDIEGEHLLEVGTSFCGLLQLLPVGRHQQP